MRFYFQVDENRLSSSRLVLDLCTYIDVNIAISIQYSEYRGLEKKLAAIEQKIVQRPGYKLWSKISCGSLCFVIHLDVIRVEPKREARLMNDE